MCVCPVRIRRGATAIKNLIIKEVPGPRKNQEYALRKTANKTNNGSEYLKQFLKLSSSDFTSKK